MSSPSSGQGIACCSGEYFIYDRFMSFLRPVDIMVRPPQMMASIKASGVSMDCSPVIMFFSVTLPSAISLSPTMAT